MLQPEIKVTRRLLNFGHCIAVGAILLACFCGPARGQDADTSNSSQAGTSASASADDIISTLRQDSELLQQVKSVVIQKAQEQGRRMDSAELTDEALFRMIREDRSVRMLVAREIEQQEAVDPENRDAAGPDDRESVTPNNRDSINPEKRELSGSEKREAGDSESRGSSGTENREPVSPKEQRTRSAKRPATRPPIVDQNQPATKGESVLLAVGILGATVMPHAIYLHSALMQSRIIVREPGKLRRLLRFEITDVSIAMGIAGLINMAMLVMAAATFFSRGITSMGSLEEAHKTLEPLLGKAASWVFGVSLLASGLSSSTVGTMAGQVIMQGFVQRRIPAWIRRLATMVPSLVVIAIGLDPSRTLVFSQVVLSFGLPFAIIPLVMFTRRKGLMGVLVNKPLTTALAVCAAALIVGLNLYLLYQTFFGG